MSFDDADLLFNSLLLLGLFGHHLVVPVISRHLFILPTLLSVNLISVDLPDVVHQMMLSSEEDSFAGSAGEEDVCLVLGGVEVGVEVCEVVGESCEVLAEELVATQSALEPPQV